MEPQVSQTDFRSRVCTILPSFGAENTQLTVTFPRGSHQDASGLKIALGQFMLNTTVLNETDELLSLTGSVPTIVPVHPSMMARVPIQFPVYLVQDSQSFLVGHFGYLMPTRTWNSHPVAAVPPWASASCFIRGVESEPLHHQHHLPAPPPPTTHMETGLAGMPMAGHPGETSSPGEVYFDHYFHDTPSMPEHEHFTGSSTDHAQIARYEGAVGNHPHFEHALHDDARHGITQSPSEQSHLSFNSVGLSALSSGISSSPSTDSHLTYRKRGRSVKKASSPRPRKKKSKSKKAPSPPRQALHNQGKLEVEFYAAAERDQGGLDALVLDWTQQETHSGRRVVAFWRLPEQLTHTPKMRVQYRSLAQSNTGMCTQEQPHRQQQQQYAAVSCVYWPERKEHYITSVDIVTLIEFLMQCQFTVEEKNRVRRNLEGFQPTTVSKCKRATEEFFKRIMRFDAPRPRNIEKDIKVYPWLTLTQAIIKVVSKLHDTVRPTPQRRMLPVPEADKEGLQHISTTQESSDSRDSGEEQHLESV